MMTTKMLQTVLAAACAMMLGGTVQAADAGSMNIATAKTIYSQGAKADYLAGYHLNKKPDFESFPTLRV